MGGWGGRHLPFFCKNSVLNYLFLIALISTLYRSFVSYRIFCHGVSHVH